MPVDPPEPVVSANAAGIHNTAEPTPNATASAPTRPTDPAYTATPGSSPDSTRRRPSIKFTSPFAARR